MHGDLLWSQILCYTASVWFDPHIWASGWKRQKVYVVEYIRLLAYINYVILKNVEPTQKNSNYLIEIQEKRRRCLEEQRNSHQESCFLFSWIARFSHSVVLQAQGLCQVPDTVFHFLGEKTFCIVEKICVFEFIDMRVWQLPIATTADVVSNSLLRFIIHKLC